MRALLNWRYYILTILAMLTILGIFSEPLPDSETWYRDMFISKLIGFGSGYLFAKLVQYWEARNAIPELSEELNEEEDDLWE